MTKAVPGVGGDGGITGVGGDGGNGLVKSLQQLFSPAKKKNEAQRDFSPLRGGGGGVGEGEGDGLREAGGREEGILRRERDSADEERIVRCVVLAYADVC